jgi:MFS family permease
MQQTPLPWKRLAPVLFVVVTEPLGLTIFFPYMSALILSFPGLAKSPGEVGLYASLLAATFSMAQFLFSLFWGHLSDRIGRKPVLLVGLTGNCIMMTLFGLSKEYWQAMVIRFMAGALNGNIGVVKCILAEMSDDSNIASAFGWLNLVWTAGSIIGPLIGGLLSNPIKSGLVPEDNVFFQEYPFFLPPLASVLASFIGLILLLLWFDERKGYVELVEPRPEYEEKFKISVSGGVEGAGGIIEPVEIKRPAAVRPHVSTSLMLLPKLSVQSYISGGRNSMISAASSQAGIWGKDMINRQSASISDFPAVYDYISSSLRASPMPHEPKPFHQTDSLFSGGSTSAPDYGNVKVDSDNASVDIEEGEDEADLLLERDFEYTPKPKISKNSFKAILAYTLLALGGVLVDEIFSLFAYLPAYLGGLGFLELQIGLTLAVCGVLEVVFQGLLFARLERTFPLTKLFLGSMIIFGPACFLLSFLSRIQMSDPNVFPPKNEDLFKFNNSVYLDLSGASAGSTESNLSLDQGAFLRLNITTQIYTWIALLSIQSVKVIAQLVGYTSIMVIVNNSADMENLGFVNGISQSAAAFVRGIGPGKFYNENFLLCSPWWTFVEVVH